MGGECNFLFQLDPKSRHLRYIKPELYQPDAVRVWSDSPRLVLMLDVAQSFLEKSAGRMGIASRVEIIREEKAVGLICPSGGLAREQLDELALGVQEALRVWNQGGDEIPLCAFNGGSDVWCDVGNKLIGVGMLRSYIDCEGGETLVLWT
jgi:IMP and pyridine-specific 5'-nucleotidase